VFTSEERDRVRDRVFELARADERVTGGAITGSGSVGADDRWSDVDTAFGLAAGVDREAVLADWTDVLDQELDVVHRFDLRHGPTIYRVYLLSSGLELDISVTPAAEFGAQGPNFRLEFGQGAELPPAAAPDVDSLIGWGWIYAFYARAGIERGRPWVAEFGIGGVRDQGLALACVRKGLPAAYARGADRLDPALTRPWEETLVRSLEPSELRRALAVAAVELVREIGAVRPALAGRLAELLPVRRSPSTPRG